MPYFSVAIILAGVYCIGNGILHDAFVLSQHKDPYDRTLLRLLMDGHILITCGAIYIAAFFLLNRNDPVGLYLCIVAAVSLLIYCGMIFPFLKSIVTIVINALILCFVIAKLLTGIV